MTDFPTNTADTGNGPGLLVWIVILLATASFGFGYGIANQNTYLIEGLTWLDPDFLKHDWFARNTTHYHASFAYVVWLAGLGGSLAWNLTLINSLCIGATIFLLYRLSNDISSTDPIAVFLLLMFIVVVEKTSSVEMTEMYSSYLQPSTFGYALTMIAVWAFLRGRYFASGLALATAGYFHANFLLLGPLFFGFAHCLLGTEGIAKRLALQLGASTALVGYDLPFLIQFATHEHAETARVILTTIRSPHHYLPAMHPWDFVPFAGWHIAALGSLGLADINPRIRKRFIALHLAFFSLIAVATVLTTVVFVPVVSQLFFWRMTPFSIMFAQLIWLSVVVRYLLAGRNALPAVPYWRTATIAVGVLLIAAWNQHEYRLFANRQIAMAFYFGVLALGLLLRHFRPTAQRAHRPVFALHAVALVLLAAGLCATAKHTYANSALLNGFPGKHESELYGWVRTTDDGSVFAVPPDLENFRIHGRRAIVVDWKSIPIDADGILQWRARTADVCGIDPFHSKAEVLAGYSEIDAERANLLARRYDVEYVVMRRDGFGQSPSPRLAQFRTVYRNDGFEVKAIAAP